MNIFTEVKQQVNPKQAVRYYLGKPSKEGMTDFYRSPFRNEENPSFAVHNKKGLTDFGSGEHYDIISFVGKLFKLDNLKSAKKIVSDFHLHVSDNPFDESKSTVAVIQINNGLLEWRNKAFDRLCVIFHATQYAKKTLSPDSVGYFAACQFEGLLDYWTDCLISDDESTWLRAYRKLGKGWGLS